MNKDSSPLHLALAAIFTVQAFACDQGETKIGEGEAGVITSGVIQVDPAAGPQAESELFSRAPYLQLSTPNSMFVAWRTSQQIAPVVRFGSRPDLLDRDATSIGVRQTLADNPTGKNPLHSAPQGTFQYEAAITGLEPDTRYYYAVYDGDTRLTPADGSYHLQTHPKPGADRDVYFWAVGDSGTGAATQANVHNAMIAHNKKIGRELDLYLHVGDMAYSAGTDTEFSGHFFAMYEPTLRNIPCWAAMGNHEGATSRGKTGIGPFYDAYICPKEAEAGGVPSGNESYYSFDYAKVHFICLNSYDLDRSASGAMAMWLKADLEATKADWIVCYFHHPPYTKGSHDSDNEIELVQMRELIMPILESGGVDVTLTGHSHIYERSMLVDGAYATPTTATGVIIDDGDGDPEGDGAYKKTSGLNPHNGSVNIVTGHGGTGVGRMGTMPIMRKIIVENGSTLIHIEGDTLHGTMVNYQGDVRDTFAIVKSPDVPIKRQPIDAPWQPGPKTAEKKTAQPAGEKVVINVTPLMAADATWRYLAGDHPEGDWTAPGFDDNNWKEGHASFGYGDNDDATILDDMKDHYKTVYLRTSVNIPPGANADDIFLAISYDDAFIAYLNGKEILRSGIDSGAGRTARGLHPHEANRRFEFFPLTGNQELIKSGANTLAIEGHNAEIGSSDFTLHPLVVIKTPEK